VESVAEVVISGVESTSATPPLPTSGFYPNGAIVGYDTPGTLYHIWDEAATVDWPLYVVIKDDSAVNYTANFEVSKTFSEILSYVNAKPDIGDIWPVGSRYITSYSANPSSYWPGTTWQAVGQGRVMVGAGQLSGGNTYTAGATGGAETWTSSHSHTMPHTHGMQHYHECQAHAHGAGTLGAQIISDGTRLWYNTTQTNTGWRANYYFDGSGYGSAYYNTSWVTDMQGETGAGGDQPTLGSSTDNTGAASSSTTSTVSVGGSLMQPYEVVYIWERVA
jgi:hypothetical protein